MGRQIAIATSLEDERMFFEFVRSISDVRILEHSADSPENLWVDSFHVDLAGHYQYRIWNTDFAWSPEYRRLEAEETRFYVTMKLTGGVWQADTRPPTA